MDTPERRSSDVNDVLAAPLTASTGSFNTAEGFEVLYRNTFPRVYAYVASLLRDRSAAEDVTSQAFERAYRKRSGFSAKRGSPEAWVFGIARNAALDELRRRKRSATLASEPGDVWTPGPEEQAERAFRRDQIRAGAPTPAADFKLRMDARVAAGFPRRRARTVRMPALVVRRPHLAILGAAASLLIALIVAGSLSGGGAETRSASVAASNEAA